MQRYVVAAALFASTRCIGADAPRVPCPGPPVPAYAAVGAKPQWQEWSNVALEAPCARSAAGRFDLAVALSGTFEEKGGANAILERLGGVSRMTGIQYFSDSSGRSQPMLSDSAALSSSKPDARRADFSAGELRTGAAAYYTQTDPASGIPVVYRMSATSADKTLVVESVNVTPVKVRVLGVPVTVFEPEGLRTLHFLQPERDGVWNYYLLTLADSKRAAGRKASIENRALALYRYVAGQAVAPGERLDDSRRGR